MITSAWDTVVLDILWSFVHQSLQSATTERYKLGTALERVIPQRGETGLSRAVSAAINRGAQISRFFVCAMP